MITKQSTTSSKIRVLHAIRQGQIGGGESHVIDLVQTLDPTRYESLVLSFTDGPMVERMNSLGVKVFVIPTERPFDFRVWRSVRQLMVDKEVDLLHAHGTRANSNTHYSARKLKIPIVYTVHGWSFHPDQNPVIRMVRTLSEKYLVKHSNCTICVSYSNLQDGMKRFAMDRATVIRPSVDLNKFNSGANFQPIRTEFGLKDNEVVVGYIVRMTKQKDPITLVQSIALLPADLSVKFLLIGDGELKNKVVNLVHKLGLTDKVIFLGFRQDVPDILNAIDIYCLPSLWEGLPIGVLEAMAMGKAVVASAVDGTREVIENGRNGLLVAKQSPEKLAEALTGLISNRFMRDQLGAAAQYTITKEFGVHDMVRNIEQVYQRVMTP